MFNGTYLTRAPTDVWEEKCLRVRLEVFGLISESTNAREREREAVVCTVFGGLFEVWTNFPLALSKYVWLGFEWVINRLFLFFSDD